MVPHDDRLMHSKRTHKTLIPVACLCCYYRHKGEVSAVLVLAMKAYKGSGSIAPLILNFVTGWKSFADPIGRAV